MLETAEGKIGELTAKVDEQQKLIQKLEDDISKVRFSDYESAQIVFVPLQLEWGRYDECLTYLHVECWNIIILEVRVMKLFTLDCINVRTYSMHTET